MPEILQPDLSRRAKGCKRYGSAVQAQEVAAPEAEVADSRPTTPRALDAYAIPVVLVAISAIAHVLVAWMQSRTLQHTTIRGLLARWDSGFYLKIANTGYPTHLKIGSGNPAQSTIGFYPLFGLVVRGAWKIGPFGLTQTGILTAILCAAGAAVVMWRLAYRLCDSTEAAHRSVAFFAFAPGAIVLSMPYSEGLFILLAAATLLMLVEKRWVFAGLFALVACTARPNSLAVVAACAVAAVLEWWPNKRALRPLIAPVLAGIGFALFPLYLWVHVGDPLAYWKTQHRGWGQGIDFGKNTVLRLWHVAHHPTHDFNLLMATLAIIAIVIGFVLMAQWRPPPAIVAYTVVVVFLALASTQLVSTWRFAMTAFPFAIAYGRSTRGTVFGVALAVSAILFTAVAFGATTLLFTP
jgi:hypothetical protein